MLVLARQEGEAIVIGSEIIVTVLSIDFDSITVRIDSLLETEATTTDLLGTESLAVDLLSES